MRFVQPHRRIIRPLALLTLLVLVPLIGALPVGVASAQSVEVTFRFVPQPENTFVRAFLPGEFNNWGPNSNGVIAVGAASQMTLDAASGDWLYTTALNAGADYQYKVHLHLNATGTSNQWLSDPLNPQTNPADNNNSVITVADPMVFQLARKRNAGGMIEAVSAGIFGTADITSLTFEVNGVEADGIAYFDSQSRIFRYALPVPVPAGSQFKVTATDASGATVSDEVGLIPPVVVDEPLPDGIRDGINYDPANSTKVTLSLFAPGISYVHVIGDFNNWAISDAYLMKRDSLSADSIRFWLELPSITPGPEYAFQYLINGQRRVGDPYSAKILDPSNDAFISATTYPGLKSYPTQTSGIVSVLQVPTASNTYQWTTTDYERPEQSQLVIYELLIRDFIAKHDYSTLIDTLDYIQNLGINAIELMPVAEFDGNDSWGYNPAFHLALDKYYGPANDFKRFVDACHARGIAVIMDVVYNHVTEQSPLYQIWGGATASPYLNTTATHPFSVFVDVNHEYTGTRYWLDRANEWWLTEYRVDGFRFDLSKGFTQRNSGSDVGFWGQYDASRVATLERMADRIWDVDSTAIIILEHFAENSEEKVLAEYRTTEGRPGMMLWAEGFNLNHDYNEATMGYNNSGNSDFSEGFWRTRGWSVPNMVTYMESHDEQWLMYKNIAFGACENFPAGGSGCDTNPGDYSVREFPIAFDRQKMAGAFFLTIPGPRMIWQFGELGYGYGPDGRECLISGDGLGDCPAGTPGRVSAKPIRWQYREDPLRYRIYQTWSELLRLRRTLPVFSSTATSVTQLLSSGVKVLRLNHPFDADAVVIGNFGVLPASGQPGFPQAGTWYDFFSGDSIEVVDPSMSMELAAGEFHVYTSVRVDPPPPGLITVGVDDQLTELPLTLDVQAYPNPFERELRVHISAAEPGPVVLEVFDILGRRVDRQLIDAGVVSDLRVDATALASGVYFVRVQLGKEVFTRKLIKQ